MSKKVLARLAGAALVLVAGAALTTAVSAAGGGGGGFGCPDVWNPVICSNGQVYSNQCYANLAHAKNCVPYGDTRATRDRRVTGAGKRRLAPVLSCQRAFQRIVIGAAGDSRSSSVLGSSSRSAPNTLKR